MMGLVLTCSPFAFCFDFFYFIVFFSLLSFAIYRERGEERVRAGREIDLDGCANVPIGVCNVYVLHIMFIVLLCSARAPIYCCILHGQLCERILSTILRENCRFFHFHFSHFVSCAFFSFFSVYVRCANGKTLPSELTSVTFPFVLFISFSLLLAVWAVAFNNSPINAARTATAMPKATETHRVDNMRVIINYTLATHQLG